MQVVCETRPRELADPVRTRPSDRTDIRIPGLEVLGFLGSGGFADVHLAWEPRFSRRVAVKVFRTRTDGLHLRSFKREAMVLARLSGIPHVVRAHQAGVTSDGAAYLVLEALSEPLAAAPTGHCLIGVDATIHTGALLGRTLMAVHDQGILHCDIKPANLLRDDDGELKLIDFGIAAVGDNDAGALEDSFTAEHAAPERFEGARPSAASDVYSLASTLYQLVQGRPAFEPMPGEQPLDFMGRVQRSQCPPCHAALRACPPLNDVLMAALDRRPEARPPLAWVTAALMQLATTRQHAQDSKRSHPSQVIPMSGT